MRNRFAVEHDAGGGEGAHGVGNRDEVTRPVPAVAGPQVNPLAAVLMGDDAEAVVLQLVNPVVAGRHLGGKRRPARDNEPGRPQELRPSPACRGAHQHRGTPYRSGSARVPEFSWRTSAEEKASFVALAWRKLGGLSCTHEGLPATGCERGKTTGKCT